MDKSIPQAGGFILEFLGGIEAPKGHNTVYGNNQSKLPKPLTQMTLGEVIAAGPSWTKRWRSSAAGRYQFMNNTLKDLQKELGLRNAQVFDANLQDRLGFHLLRRRGYDKWASGAMSPASFALGLAKEWASIPVLSDMKGNSRQISRGQSYYAGDALNKSLVSPAAVEQMLREAMNLSKAIPILPWTVVNRTPAVPRLTEEVAVHQGSAPVPGMESPGEGAAILTQAAVVVGRLRKVNPEQAGSLFRTALQLGGAYLTTKGFIGGADWEQISGPLLVLLTTAWGMWARSDKNLLASAAEVPAVRAIVVDNPRVEDKVADHRVVTEPVAKENGLL